MVAPGSPSPDQPQTPERPPAVRAAGTDDEADAGSLRREEPPTRVAIVRMPMVEFAKRAGLVVGLAAAALAVLLFLWVGASLLGLLFAGVLLGVLLRALSEGVERLTGLGHGWSLAIVLVAIVGLVVGGGWWAAPRAVEQVSLVGEVLPRSVDELEERLSQTAAGRWLVESTPEAESLLRQPGRIVIDRATGLLAGTLGLLVSVVVVAVVGVYLAASPRLYTSGIVSLVAPKHRERARQLLRKLYDTLRWWLIGQGIAMASVAVVMTTGLWLLGLEGAVALGVFAGLMDFVPNLGPYVGATPAVLVAMPRGGETVLWVIGLVVVAQTLEGYIITPMIQQQTVHLPPALTIAAQLVLGVLLGAIGVIIAAPATAATIVLVRELYVKDTLGDVEAAGA